ncbi:MAG TPA: SpvB/TcaC N-terminal domain-containing protein [Candidatus Sulfotelmatobacter sp.]
MPEIPSSTAQDASSSNSGSSSFTASQISLPKGGGAIRGIGEKFSANSATGTGSLTIPIALSAGRSGFGPQLSLSYDSGSGNGPFGIGWNLSLPSITRKTDKGLPRYRDGEKSDVFILSGSEDLVPLLQQNSDGQWVNDEFDRDGYRVKRYRPRIEGLFARIERWTRLEDGDEHWRSLSKDNILTVYGRDANSRIFDPCNPRHVFSWLICESYDNKGNAVVYEYVAENDAGVDHARPNERNRSRTANRYLKRIRYGNRHPLLLDVNVPSFRSSHIEVPELSTARWMFEAVFDYGDGHYSQEPPDDDGWLSVRATPTTQPGCHWPVRRDPFSSYRSGFEVRTYRLCRRVLMFHHFLEELGAEDYLVRSTEFEYHEKTIGSFISRVTQSGYTLQADECYRKKSLPALDLAYTASPLDDREYSKYEVKEADPENLPAGIDGENYKWLDLDGEGISGVLVEQGDAWFYKPNAGRGRFRPIELVAQKPSLAALSQGKQQFLDIAGDGNLDLVQLSSPTPGFYERTLDEGWGSFRTFRSLPVLDWEDPNLRFVDITGDGIADVLITEDDAFTWHPSFLDQGFGTAVRVPVPHDEREGPHVVFADGTQSVYLADMSGDGLSDIVRVRNGEVCYWPNLGYGNFGCIVTMDNSPRFGDSDLFDQKRVKLADTDGSGTTDILYLGGDGIKVFLNQAGNGWSDARVLPQFAAANDLTSVSVVDFLGRGTACLLWSSELPSDSGWPLRYVDLMAGQKPHLLVNIRNNLGAETRIEYASSTEFYLADEAAGTPWVTRLPFPVQVVKRVETYDYVSRNRFVRTYSFHHGFFDGLEREFRGFGRVDQLDTEDFATLSLSGAFPVGENINAESSVPPMLTKTWFHTGVYLGSGRISRHLAHEYYREPGLRDQEQEAMLLDDTIPPGHLTPEEAREACRSLKGSTLRQEIYALDGKEESCRPYTVSESNFTIRPLQPRGRNLHAVFFTHARESVSFNYERKLYDIDGCLRADPRAAHNVILRVDDYGNVLQSASIGYGRRFRDRSAILTAADREKQEKILSTFTQNRYTNAVKRADAHRTPLLCETRQYELLKIWPSAHHFGVTNLFRFHELAEKIAQASDGLHDLPYEDVEARGAVENAPYRRRLKQSRTFYRSDALDRILPMGVLEALALPGENYQLAFTLGLLEEVYRRPRANKPPENLLPDHARVLGEGGYTDLENNGHWWARSGRVFYSPRIGDTATQELAHAERHFFLPDRFRDPFGNVSTIRYDVHDFAPVESRDAVGNTIEAQIDYRVLSQFLMTDANGNRSQVTFDAMGLVVGTAVMGKKGEDQGDTLEGFVADLGEGTALAHIRHPLHDPWQILQGATTRLVYDLFAYERTRNNSQPQPAVVYTMARETHVSDLQPGEKTKIQHGFSYSDGFSREIQKKMQAAPGPLVETGPSINPRWIGSGWTIFNNKGKPVRQYEPFFSATQEFEFANVVGVSPVLFYDPVERVIATLHPNHVFEKVLFDPWQQDTWDVNDTVLETDPTQDPDVGDFFQRLPKADYLPTWYSQRESGVLSSEQQAAATKAAVHARTPGTSFFDNLGRSFLSVSRNRFLRDEVPIDQRFTTRIELDIESNQLAIIDALHRRIMSYDYDMIKTKIHQNSADAGERWTLNDVVAKTLLTWDSRQNRLRREYDALRRPIALLVKTGDSVEIQAERIVYGEGQPDDQAMNLRLKTFQQFDGAGVVTNQAYDFKGNLLSSTRQLLEDYKHDVNWSKSPTLEEEIFTSSTTYDALNRPVTLTTPDASVIRPGYNPSSLLNRIDVNLRGMAAAQPFVSHIDYNAKAQRVSIDYGNGANTTYAYDPLTFRLEHFRTTRRNDHALLQDLHYAYDPIGNITSIHDNAQQTVYFKNQVVSASNQYVYDAVYRLIHAQGRELIGLLAEPQTTFDDGPRMHQPLPTDGQAMRCYRESYDYDAVGNILKIIHRAADGNWTRSYSYEDAHPRNNRLTGTRIGEFHEQYAYDANGNMVRMPHLPAMEWDFKDQLHMTQRQVMNHDQGERTYYVYDSSGKRVRKVSDGVVGAKKKERVYVGGFEIYREFGSNGAITLERETLHVMDDKKRIALVETKTVNADDGLSELPYSLTRYQFDNHLGSACLELDENASVISYEEYYPYGSTSLQSVRTNLEVSPKRYRYTGKERDEETGFNYHGVRYYATWLGRWTSCDPTGLADGDNLYWFVRNNPLRFVDPAGRAANAIVRLASDIATYVANSAAVKSLKSDLANVQERLPEAQKAFERASKAVQEEYGRGNVSEKTMEGLKNAEKEVKRLESLRETYKNDLTTKLRELERSSKNIEGKIRTVEKDIEKVTDETAKKLSESDSKERGYRESDPGSELRGKLRELEQQKEQLNKLKEQYETTKKDNDDNNNPPAPPTAAAPVTPAPAPVAKPSGNPSGLTEEQRQRIIEMDKPIENDTKFVDTAGEKIAGVAKAVVNNPTVRTVGAVGVAVGVAVWAVLGGGGLRTSPTGIGLYPGGPGGA